MLQNSPFLHPATMDLSVVIVNYNVKYFLEQCLTSVRRASEGLAVEVWVVDNNSSDGSMEYLKPRFPEVHFIENKDNRGFSRANNQAIRQSVGRYVLLLNPDTMVTEDTFHECVRFLDAHPEAGATGVAMYGSDGTFAWESRRGLPVPFTSFCKMTGLCSLFPHSRIFGRYYMRFLDRTQPAQIEVISGAFNMLRRETLEQIGLLDEDFFMYGEDIDLSYRVLQGGWKNYYLPTPILHYKGESTQKTSSKYVHVFYQAMLIFFDKHYQHEYRLLGFVIRLAVYVRALLDHIINLWRRLVALLPKRPPLPEKCLGVGSDVVRAEMQQICADNGVLYTEQEGESDTMYLLADMDGMSHRDVMQRLMSHRGEKHLGTYSKQTGVMILPNDIYIRKEA